MKQEKDLLLDYVEEEYLENIKNKKEDSDLYLCFGEAEYENFIVGNKKGINTLIKSCQEALKNDESHQNNLGETIEGIKLVENHAVQRDSKSSYMEKSLFIFIGLILIISFLVGFITIIKWTISFF